MVTSTMRASQRVVASSSASPEGVLSAASSPQNIGTISKGNSGQDDSTTGVNLISRAGTTAAQANTASTANLRKVCKMVVILAKDHRMLGQMQLQNGILRHNRALTNSYFPRHPGLYATH